MDICVRRDWRAIGQLEPLPGYVDSTAHAPMTRQNRVSAFGLLEAEPARGTMMGNRGCLVNAHGELVRRWQVERWITCVLKFKGRLRDPLMAPGRYTELFFLDEATACAAGHRPCHECRRDDANAFADAWRVRHPRDRRLPEIDARLHGERTREAHHRAVCGNLPCGAMVSLDGRAWLVTAGNLLAWTHTGYTDRRACPREPVTVLTPPSIVAAMREGWQPELHPSAQP